jgi:hypothetical protein
MSIKRKMPTLKQVVVVFLSFVLSSVSVHEAAVNQIQHTGTYSSLEYNKEGGNLLGMELKIVSTKYGYQGVLQISEGIPSELMLVGIQIEKENISFEIPKAYSIYGGMIFQGKFDENGITGSFISGGKPGNPEKLIRKPSYWD